MRPWWRTPRITLRESGRTGRLPPPALVLPVGFAGLILVGTLLLLLPVAGAADRATTPLDALFTATSAVCVTGLVVVDTGTHWSGFGQAIILLLMQVGGLGFMTSATLLLLLFGRRVSLSTHLLISTELGAPRLAGLAGLVRRIIGVTLALEAIGATVLALRFAADHPPATALWYGLFHAVSAFTHGSFDLFGDFRSLTGRRDDPVVLLTIAALIILGSLGVTILSEVVRARSPRRLSLDSKLVLLTTGLLLGLGTLAIGALEWRNPATLGDLPLGTRVLNAFFHAVVPRTAGFNSLDLAGLTQGALATTIVLMFIGGAPASTAGGIKVTTFSVLLAAIVATARGRPAVEAFGRELPMAIVLRALTVALLAVALVMAAALGLMISDGVSLTIALFESVSAFATVGLSTGLPVTLGPIGKIVLIVTMFAGRLGPLTLALALAQAQRPAGYRYASESVRIG